MVNGGCCDMYLCIRGSIVNENFFIILYDLIIVEGYIGNVVNFFNVLGGDEMFIRLFNNFLGFI